jgi:hypothetical protein
MQYCKRGALMFNEFDKKQAAARAITGFLAGASGTYINRVLVRIVEVWPMFHFQSISPLETLLAQDWPNIAKASLIFGLIYGIFCFCVPRHLALATVLLMSVLVLAGRAYMIDGLGIAAVYDNFVWIVIHAAVRTALLLLAYWAVPRTDRKATFRSLLIRSRWRALRDSNPCYRRERAVS